MATNINLDNEFNISQVRAAGQLVLSFLNRAVIVWNRLPKDKKRRLIQNSATIRGIAKLKKALDAFQGLKE